MRDNNLDVRIQWHDPDRVYAAVLLRDGRPWHLDGALVGMGGTPAAAVSELLALARYLLQTGTNALLDGALSTADRTWLTDKLAFGPTLADVHFTNRTPTERGT